MKRLPPSRRTRGSHNHSMPVVSLTSSTLGLTPGTGLVGSQNDRAVIGNSNGILIVGRKRTIKGRNGPTIASDIIGLVAKSNHRLNRNNHATLKANASPALSVIGNVWFLVHVMANTVASVVAHDAEAVLLGKTLNGITDIAQAIPWNSLANGSL